MSPLDQGNPGGGAAPPLVGVMTPHDPGNPGAALAGIGALAGAAIAGMGSIERQKAALPALFSSMAGLGVAALTAAAAMAAFGGAVRKLPRRPKPPGPKDWSPRTGACLCRKDCAAHP